MDNKTAPECLICKSMKMDIHFYPPNRFNGKNFHYFKCRKCKSLSVFPLPDAEDYQMMYGENDHTYLKNSQKVTHDFIYPAYNHQGFQLDFLKEDLELVNGKSLLDYACGSGFYLAFSEKMGMESVGVEIDKDFAELLRNKTGLKIYALNELKKNFSDKKFDVIHFGHILEHLADPAMIIEDLRKYAHKETIFIFDGPLEDNFCLSRWVINTGSKIRGRAFNEYAPQHLSFTNYQSQLEFFERIGFKTLRYEVREQYFPFPSEPDLSSLKKICGFLLSRTSIWFSSLFRKHGNIFHYTGKSKKEANYK